MNTILRIPGLLLAAAALILAGCSPGEEEAALEGATPYPLDVCLVSGEKLGSMGKPYSIAFEGREIKFCCDGCEGDFRKDAANFLAKLDAAPPK